LCRRRLRRDHHSHRRRVDVACLSYCWRDGHGLLPEVDCLNGGNLRVIDKSIISPEKKSGSFVNSVVSLCEE
jgi:hypothetical protein